MELTRRRPRDAPLATYPIAMPIKQPSLPKIKNPDDVGEKIVHLSMHCIGLEEYQSPLNSSFEEDLEAGEEEKELTNEMVSTNFDGRFFF